MSSEEEQNGEMTPTPTPSPMNLHLNGNEEVVEEANRRLLPLGRDSDHLLAWGGDTGSISLLDRSTLHFVQTIRHWDDEDDVKAVAVSHDAKTIALGFDSGSIMIYKYGEDDAVVSTTTTSSSRSNNNNRYNNDGETQLHPFCTSSKHGTPGPTFPASIRDLQFAPNSNSLLAIASEEGLCVVNIGQNSDNKRYLEELASEHHDGGGVRGVAFAGDGTTLASLGMDGRLCLWDTTPAFDDPSQWTLKLREAGRCITKLDVGDVLGADAWDIACRPRTVGAGATTLLFLPGEVYVQIRSLPSGKAHDQPMESGHIESIVAICSIRHEDNDYVVTSGRDKRVLLWSVHAVRRCRFLYVYGFEDLSNKLVAGTVSHIVSALYTNI
jgi:WD40 repeat protein